MAVLGTRAIKNGKELAGPCKAMFGHFLSDAGDCRDVVRIPRRIEQYSHEGKPQFQCFSRNICSVDAPARPHWALLKCTCSKDFLLRFNAKRARQNRLFPAKKATLESRVTPESVQGGEFGQRQG